MASRAAAFAMTALSEFELVARLLRRNTGHRGDVVLGNGDDAAILRLPPEYDLVVSTDTLVAGVHFPPDLNPADLGYRSLAVNLSDLAAMGATPTPMGWTEVYPALQQKVIDGAEAQDPATYGARLYEVIKYITKTGHINLITGIVTSAGWFDSLPADYQKVLRDESLAAGDEASHMTADSLANYEKMMADQGVTINEIDVTPFVEATRGVYDKLGYGELHKELEPILAN